MKRWLRSPWLSLALFASWLLLNRSVTPGHVLLAVAVSVAMPMMMTSLRPTPGPLRRWRVLAGLVARVARDVVRSGFGVGRGVLRAGKRAPRGAFVVIPLVLRDPHSLAALAVITTVIPGTVWSELAPDRSALLLHVFDLEDEAAFIDHFKADYERPLKEIFE